MDAEYVITLFVFTLIIPPAFMIYNFIFQKPIELLKKNAKYGKYFLWTVIILICSINQVNIIWGTVKPQ